MVTGFAVAVYTTLVSTAYGGCPTVVTADNAATFCGYRPGGGDYGNGHEMQDGWESPHSDTSCEHWCNEFLKGRRGCCWTKAYSTVAGHSGIRTYANDGDHCKATEVVIASTTRTSSSVEDGTTRAPPATSVPTTNTSDRNASTNSTAAVAATTGDGANNPRVLPLYAILVPALLGVLLISSLAVVLAPCTPLKKMKPATNGAPPVLTPDLAATAVAVAASGTNHNPVYSVFNDVPGATPNGGEDMCAPDGYYAEVVEVCTMQQQQHRRQHHQQPPPGNHYLHRQDEALYLIPSEEQPVIYDGKGTSQNNQPEYATYFSQEDSSRDVAEVAQYWYSVPADSSNT
eukprot:gene3963-29302_t